MRIEDIAAALACEALTPYDKSVDLESVVASDGMSEVLAFSSAGCLMLTGLTNVQAVRTAVMRIRENSAACITAPPSVMNPAGRRRRSPRA